MRPITYFKDNRDNKNNGKNRRNGRCHEVTYNKYNGDYYDILKSLAIKWYLCPRNAVHVSTKI